MPGSNSFCQFPWSHLIVNTETDSWRWCQSVDRQHNFISQYPSNSSILAEVKDSFNKNQRPLACHRCWADEDLGFRSLRQQSNGDIAYGSRAGIKFLTIELGRNNQIDIFEKLNTIISDSVSTIKLINIRARNFTNIDPVIEILRLISSLGKAPRNPELRILSDGYCTYDIDELLTKIRANGWRTNIILQIEAIGENLDFLRKSSQWETVQSNFRKLVSSGHCSHIEVNVNALNLHMLADIPRWLKSSNLIDVVRPIIQIENGIISVNALGELGLYLSPGLVNWKEHPNWTEANLKVNKLIRKNRFIKPKYETLLSLIGQIEEDAKVSGFAIPLRIRKISYLADIARREQALTVKKSLAETEDDDPVVESQADLG